MSVQQPAFNFHSPLEIYFMVYLSLNSLTRTAFVLLRDSATLNTRSASFSEIKIC